MDRRFVYYVMSAHDQRSGEMVPCKVCQNTFYVKQSKKGVRVTCSVECAAIHIKLLAEAKRLSKQCAACGAPMLVKPSHFDRRKTCSKPCTVAYQKANGVGLGKVGVRRGPRANPENMTKRTCEMCAKEFVRERSQPSKFCSRSCHGTANGKARIGERNSNWKGGNSFLPYPPEFNRKLKQQIKERDGYRCLHCGRTEEEEIAAIRRGLPIHHIDYNKSNCNPANLMTACISCNSMFNANRPYWMARLARLPLMVT